MAQMTEAQIALSRLARAAAVGVLKRGDRLRFTRCGGLVQTHRFKGWDGYWIVVHPRLRDHLWWLWRFRELALPIDDVSARHITHLNGRPVDFERMGVLRNQAAC